MTLILTFCLYFAAGLARDWLGTKFYISVAAGRRWSASTVSGLLTLLDMTVLVMVITSHHPLLALAYSLGCAVGVFVSLTGNRR